MKTIAMLVAALSLAACAAEEDMESNFPDPSGLYQITAEGPDCLAGEETYRDADAVFCRYECLHMDGRDVRSVNLTFRREADGWRRTFAGWDFGVCD